MSERTVRAFMLRVEIRRKYGDHEITFAIAEQVDCAGGQERRDAFQNLQAQLEDQINIYEKVSLPHVRLPHGAAASSASPTNQDTFPLESIIVENKQGKKYISATGGRWSKFGVPIYKGCGTDLEISSLEYGVHDFSNLNLTCTIELEDGKAKRVRSIR